MVWGEHEDDDGPPSWGRTTRRAARGGLRRRALWRRGVLRRVAAAAAAGVAVWAGVTALLPPSPDPGVPVVVAGRDVAVGEPLGPELLRTAYLPEEAVPRGAVRSVPEVVGVAAAPLREGEVLTDLRVSAVGLLTGLPAGTVLAHLPLRDPGLLPLLEAGSSVDVLSVVDGRIVAGDVLVLGPAPRPPVDLTGLGVSSTDVGPGGILVAVTGEQASALAVSSGQDPIVGGVTVVLRPASSDDGR